MVLVITAKTKRLKEFSTYQYIVFLIYFQIVSHQLVVKPFSDEVKAVADKWKELSLDWIGKERPKYIYPIQIESTYENLGIISVQAFYQDTKMKRFKDMHQSIHYVLNSIVEQLNED